MRAQGEAARRKQALSKFFAYLLLSILSVVFILPFYWLMTTSIKPDAQIFRFPPVWIPHPPVWSNYKEGLTFIPFLLFLRNTLTICFSVVVGTILSCSLVAYGFSRIEWKGRDFLFFVMLSTMMLPAQVTMIPVFMIFRKLHWINTFKPLIVPAFFGNAFFIFLLRQFFMTVPQDLIDAARIDGSSEFGIYWRIMMPLSKPALATVGLFSFLNSWNDFINPLIYLLDEDKYTLSIGLAMFQGQYGSEYGQLMAVTTVMTVPIIILFFFTQRTFIQGIKLTGLKM